MKAVMIYYYESVDNTFLQNLWWVLRIDIFDMSLYWIKGIFGVKISSFPQILIQFRSFELLLFTLMSNVKRVDLQFLTYFMLKICASQIFRNPEALN
jgi:hypothetical protein